MNEEKQIEEMARIIDDNHGFIVSSVETAEALYNAGYRKQSEVAREIFEDIEEEIERWETIYSRDHFGDDGGAYGYLETDVDHTIYELKKKYIGDTR